MKDMRPSARLRGFLASIAAALVAACLPAVSLSAWQPDGYQFVGPDAYGGGFKPVLDGGSGWYIPWDYPPNNGDVWLQHTTLAGESFSGWPSNGIPIAAKPWYEGLLGVSPDAQGGVILTWRDDRIDFGLYAQRILADGSIAPGWASTGAPVCTTALPAEPSWAAADGLGGVFIAWDDYRGPVRVQHLTPAGDPAPGWPVNGQGVGQYPGSMSGANMVLPDGQGGAFVGWSDYRRYPNLLNVDAYATRLRPDGGLAPGWQIDGTRLSLGRFTLGMVPDAAGGFYMSMVKEKLVQGGANINDDEYWVTRFTASGVPAPGWTGDGIRVRSGPSLPNSFTIVSDGLGGVITVWQETRNGLSSIYGVRILGDGSVAPGWTANGAIVSDPLVNASDPILCTDGAGGAYVGWESYDFRCYLKHLGPNGTPAPGWLASGVPISSNQYQFYYVIAPDPEGGVLAVWAEQTPGHSGLFAQRYTVSGIVATQLSLASSDVRWDGVTLLWQGAGAANVNAAVSRREPNGLWRTLGNATHQGADRLRFEDADVTPGARYAYRLVWSEGGGELTTAESWIDVPLAAQLALEGLRPNPAVDAINVSFSLASSERASLEMVDLAGRRVLEREVGTLGAGRHLLRLDRGERLVPGMYWLRLRQGEHQFMTRAVVTR